LHTLTARLSKDIAAVSKDLKKLQPLSTNVQKEAVAKKLFENSKLMAFVIEDDEHHSPARIAGVKVKWQSLAEGEQHLSLNCSSSSATDSFV